MRRLPEVQGARTGGGGVVRLGGRGKEGKAERSDGLSLSPAPTASVIRVFAPLSLPALAFGASLT